MPFVIQCKNLQVNDSPCSFRCNPCNYPSPPSPLPPWFVLCFDLSTCLIITSPPATSSILAIGEARKITAENSSGGSGSGSSSSNSSSSGFGGSSGSGGNVLGGGGNKLGGGGTFPGGGSRLGGSTAGHK